MKSSGTLYRNFLFCICLMLIALPVQLMAQQLSEPRDLSLTIYNNNQSVVNEQRTLDGKEGIFTVQLNDISNLIDPSSMVIRFPGQVMKQEYRRQQTTMRDVLKSYIGHQIRFVNETGHVRSGELIALQGDQAIIHSPNEGGYIIISHLWDHTFIFDNLLAKPSDSNSVTWTLKGDKKGKQPFNFTYQTGGLSWDARYNLILQSDQKADLTGSADIKNQTDKNYTDASITLVAGNVHQANNPQPRMQEAVVAAYAAKDAVQQRAFSDYHLYDLQGKQTIASHSDQLVPLVEGDGVGVGKKYIYRSGGYYAPLGSVNSHAVTVSYTIVNTKKNHLGKPLPAGVVSIYKQDGNNLVLLGKDNIDHTAANDSISVTQGEAFDVNGSDKVTDIRQISQKVTERDVEVELSNQKDSDITVKVIQRLNANDQIFKSNYKYEKQSAYVYEFDIPVASQKTAKLEYSVRTTNR